MDYARALASDESVHARTRRRDGRRDLAGRASAGVHAWVWPSQDEHLLAPGDIPVVHTERGGQVTYHGPGQIVAYVLLDLRRAGLTVRGFVERLEQAVIDTLAAYGVRRRAVPAHRASTSRARGCRR